MNSPALAHRHAAYFAPAPDSAAWHLGAQWLGRCPHSGQRLHQPRFQGVEPATLARLTQAPRRYGWHATLKAPFALGAHSSPAQLQRRFLDVAGAVKGPFTVEVELAHVGNFLALVPRQPCAALHALADACVRQLHDCAAPLPPSEIERRSRGGLSPRQSAMLAQWGYPYVLQDFAFHITLTGALDALVPAQLQLLLLHAATWFAPLLADGLRVDAVSWFAEDAPAGNFWWVERFGFAS